MTTSWPSGNVGRVLHASGTLADLARRAPLTQRNAVGANQFSRPGETILVDFDGPDAAPWRLSPDSMKEAFDKPDCGSSVPGTHPFASSMGGGTGPAAAQVDPVGLIRTAHAELTCGPGSRGGNLAGIGLGTFMREGGAAAVVLDEARDGTRLVLGSSGYGGFVGLLLGSVSPQYVAHARGQGVVAQDPSELEQRNHAR